MRIGSKARTAKACVAALLLVATPANAWADAADTFYERSFVLAADRKCRLFTPPVRTALAAAERQSRGAALRAGTSERELAAVAARANGRASAVACGDRELLLVRDRVDHAFSGWARTPRMTFPGDVADWQANRIVRDAPVWRLRQTSVTGASPVVFGQSSDATAGALTTVVSFVGAPRPYAARVVVRDPSRAPRPWIGQGVGRQPAELTRTFWASGSAAAPDGLLETGRVRGEAWTFPQTLAAALAELDPRETFTVEFVFRDDSVARATFEVGDFAAARAFLDLGAL